MYQRVMLRNSQNRRRVPEVNFDDETRRQRAHIFDGQHVYREVGNYQMCDITDPPLSKLLHRPEYCLSEPDERTGWWLPSFFENFRELLRRRFVGIINGQPIFDLELEEAMERLPDEEDVEAEKRLMRGESRRKAKQASTPASQPSASRAATRNTRDQVESQAGEHQEPSASTSANATAEQVGETEDDDAYQTSEPSSSEANNEEAALRPKRKSVFGRPTNKPKAKSRTSGAR